MKQNLIALFAGILFGIGLCISRMADPDKVINFLDFTGDWDPSLALVMGGALLVSIISFRFVLKRQHPLFSTKFYLPTKTEIDSKLVVGSLLFGAGWGMIGYCPGPAVTATGFLFVQPMIVVACMIIGMKTHQFISNK